MNQLSALTLKDTPSDKDTAPRPKGLASASHEVSPLGHIISYRYGRMVIRPIAN